MYKILLAVCASLFFVSCGQSKIDIEKLNISDEVQGNFYLSEFIEDLEFQPLFLSGQGFLGDHDKTAFSKDYIFVIDRTISKRLYVFDRISGKEISLELKFGEGPGELKEITDFAVYEETLYLLDGLKKVMLQYSLSDGFSNPIIKMMPFHASRVAKYRDKFCFVTGGGIDEVVYITDEQFTIFGKFFENNITHLSKPINSFHDFKNNGEEKILFHALFDNTIYQIENSALVSWKEIDFGKETTKLDKDKLNSYTMNLEGFNSFFSKIQNFKTHFTLFETTGKTFILLYFQNDQPILALGDGEKVKSAAVNKLTNDVSFEYFVPKITGVDNDYYLAVIPVDEVQTTYKGFEFSDLAKKIADYPEANFVLAKMKISLKEVL